MKLNIDTELDYGPEKLNSIDREHFPEFTFEHSEDVVPDHGTMVIEYETSRKSDDRNRDPDRRYSCTICVKKIVSAEGEKDLRPSQRDTSTEDALDALAKEKEGEY